MKACVHLHDGTSKRCARVYLVFTVGTHEALYEVTKLKGDLGFLRDLASICLRPGAVLSGVRIVVTGVTGTIVGMEVPGHRAGVVEPMAAVDGDYVELTLPIHRVLDGPTSNLRWKEDN